MGEQSKIFICIMDTLYDRITLAVMVLCLFFVGNTAFSQPSAVSNTVHNMSVSGPGTIKAVSENRVCVFCHTPHGASGEAPLWNRYETTTIFSIYPSGGSMQSTTGQPNGSSRICLSCHDGTAAIGIVRSQPAPIAMVGTTSNGTLPPTTTNLGVSLTDDHPISFVPSPLAPEIRHPLPNSPVKLDQTSQVQCRSCHDPHNNQYGKFLVTDPANGALCVTCHNLSGWDISSHGNPANTQFNQLIGQACSSCHLSHNATASPRLLREPEETLCFSCHDGTQNQSWETSGAVNMVNVFQKVSRHDVAFTSGIHDPGEGPMNSLPTPSSYLPEQSPVAQRHVECADCHNAHAATTINQPGQINGSLRQVWGVSAGGTKVDPAVFEYQICFKCHSDSRNLPPNSTNTRLDFAISNASFHPVIAPGTNSNVPGLLAPWTTSSTMNCSDCHNSDEDGSPLGPHGSNYSPILKRNYFTGIGKAELPFTYSSCYECHDRASLYNHAVTHFSEHSRHVVNDMISCYLCHTSHGTPINTHLIRFDPNNPEIHPTANGRLEYQTTGDGHGTCFVRCHDHDHNPSIY